MVYIIDANNLAGRLKMLGQDNFDKQLIDLIKKYNQSKRKKIVLVFDGNDPMGDKVTIDSLITAVYSPRDGYYQSADDKIVELVERESNLENQKLNLFQDEVTVITDDIGLRGRIEKVNEDRRQLIKLKRVTEFMEKILPKPEQFAEDGSRDLSKKEKEDINKELLDIWR